MLEIAQLIASACRLVSQRQGNDARPTDEALNPSPGRYIKIDAAEGNQQRNFPGADSAQTNCAAVLPAAID